MTKIFNISDIVDIINKMYTIMSPNVFGVLRPNK